MSASNGRGWLHKIFKWLGDVNAVRQGKVGQRAGRRATGKASGKLIRKLFR